MTVFYDCICIEMGLLVYPYCLVNTLLVTCDCDTVWGLIGGYYAVWSPQS